MPTRAEAAAAATSQTKPAAPKKPIIMEMKDRPEIEADYDSEPNKIKLIVTVERENSAANIDLDVADTQLKLESPK